MVDELIRLDKAIVGIDVLITKAETAAEANGLFKAKDVIYSQQRYFADVQPIRHGRWTDNVYKYVKSLDAYFIQAKCSVCGRYSDRIDIYSRFMSNECCSRCGARMDGDTE